MLILQNDIGNRFSPTTIVIPLTSIQKKKAQPTHVTIDCEFLESESTLLLEQIRTIDKTRLSDYLGQISKEDRSALDSEVQKMTEKENAAVQKASLCYSINMLRLLLSMRLITEEEYNRILHLTIEHYDPQKKLCLFS